MTDAKVDTRTRILEAAWTLLRARSLTEVTIAEIAATAGVSRQLVYFHFDSRAGLLAAMARFVDVRSGFVDRVNEAHGLPPVAALETLIRAWCDYVPEILPVARALEAAAATGDEGGAAWHDRMAALHDVFRTAVTRIAADGRLASGWDVETAADWVWSRCHLDSWQHLVVERGWRPEDYTRRCIESILHEVVV